MKQRIESESRHRIQEPAGSGSETGSARGVTRQLPGRNLDSLLTISEVLAELKVARSTFDTWRLLGLSPECIKLPNGQLRVRRSALDTWLSGHVETRTAS